MDEGTKAWLELRERKRNEKRHVQTYGEGRHHGIDSRYIWMLFGNWERDYLLYWY